MRKEILVVIGGKDEMSKDLEKLKDTKNVKDYPENSVYFHSEEQLKKCLNEKGLAIFGFKVKKK